MKKKIMGIGIGILTMAAVIWGYQNYKKEVSDGNEIIQSEKTVKRQETKKETDHVTEMQTDFSKKQPRDEMEKETDEEEKTGSLITKKKEKNSEKETEESQEGSPLIQKKQENDSWPEETEQELKPLIQKKDPSEFQPETLETDPEEEDPNEPPEESETETMSPQQELQTEEQKESEWIPPFIEGNPSEKKETISVFVTAQLEDAVEEIKEAYVKKNKNVSLEVTVAQDNILYQKVMNGEKCDVYLSGSLEYLEMLAGEKKIDKNSIHPVAENPVVLIQRENGDCIINNFNQIAEAQDFAIAQQDTELGKVSREVLEKMGIQITEMDYSEVGNANAVMASVSTKSSEVGIVYGTDAADAEGLVEVIAQAPKNLISNPIYFYSGAPEKESKTTEIEGKDEFLFYLKSDEAADILEKYGLSTAEISQ